MCYSDNNVLTTKKKSKMAAVVKCFAVAGALAGLLVASITVLE